MSEIPQPEYRSHGFSLEEILAQLKGRLELDQQELQAQLDSLKADGRARYTDRNGQTITVERYPDGKYGFETSEPAE
ncbi:MAG: hypothetical protein HY421_01110 [Candidatus Kerfeldbacteria bacterium]|nr:hypothetical protein [Candidatus Kerfeldbacteria bacterium]